MKKIAQATFTITYSALLHDHLDTCFISQQTIYIHTSHNIWSRLYYKGYQMILVWVNFILLMS